MTWRTSLEPLGFRAFRLLLAGRLADNLAHAIAPIALAFAVLDLGGTPSQLGLVLACRAIPTVLLILFGGVIADRLPRHLVLVVANIVGAATQALVALLVLSGAAEIWMLAAIEVVNGSASAFLFPAASGLTPQTVPATQLQPANALLRLMHNGAFITGAAGAGLLVATAGPGWAFAIDALLYLAGAVLLARLPVSHSARLEKTSTLTDLRTGWTEFSSRTWLWVVVLVFSFVNAAHAAALQTLGPVVADDTIGRAAWGGVLAAMAVGMLVGGVIALRSNWDRPLFVGVCTVLLEAPVILVLGVHPHALTLAVAAFIAGVGLETFAVAWDVSMQTNIPQDRLSRVYAYDWFGSLVFIPIGQILAGPISDKVGVRPTIVGAGVLVLVATLTALCVPSIRHLRRVETAPTAAEPAAL
ncbi:MAG TPA: MFS transporter [Actinomycetes bacterium]|nr:MFS transporter [Actinomycetes bacterium]